MNPTIIVQQNIGVPANLKTAADSGSQLNEKGKSVAAIIRPMPRTTGKGESIRLDAGESNSPRPHVRTNQLDDYVNWLRGKLEQDKADTRPVAEAEMAEAQPTSIPVQLEPVVAETVLGPSPSHEHVLSDYFFSTISTETVVSDETASYPSENLEPLNDTKLIADTKPKQFSARGYSKAKLDRIDQPHTNLSKANVAFDELKVGANGTPAVSFEPVGDSVPSKTKMLQPKKLSIEETERFIATISNAIASVLTDTSEPEFEQKIRSHFESELQARAVRAIASTEIESIDTDKLDHAPVDELAESGGIPVAAMKSEADKIAREIFTSARKEIPTSVAAWDVEDFRWPVVTNQMIVSGGAALDQLSQSAFDMITPGHQRFAIAGLGRSEGTTSIAISMARWAAACGKNVLLVDADLASPGLSPQVGLAPNISWINAVSQSLPSAEVIVRSRKSNLCIMPLAQMVSRVTWPRFIYDNLGKLMDQVQNHFDLILLDVGPANQLMAELSRPLLLVDATLLVYNGVNSPEFQQTKSRLEMFGLNKFIVAQNRAQQKSVNVA